MKKFLKQSTVCLLIVLVVAGGLPAGCATPRVHAPEGVFVPPRLQAEALAMQDGYRLPLSRWGPAESNRIRAVLLALHGFNDYANAFSGVGGYLAEQGVLTYAYDQRGFGRTADPGHWPGTDRLIADLETSVRLLGMRHPRLPIFVLGESMGGAVVLASRVDVAGVVLIAPAVWSRDRMNPLQRLALWTAAHTFPGLEVNGNGLRLYPSDNMEMLREYSADPWVLKETRIDGLWGVTNAMDRAVVAIERVVVPTLILYGENDKIIPKRPYCALVRDLPVGAPQVRLALYKDGWHMLTRDRQGERVLADIATWLTDWRAPLPSGEEAARGDDRIRRLCGVTRLETDG